MRVGMTKEVQLIQGLGRFWLRQLPKYLPQDGGTVLWKVSRMKESEREWDASRASIYNNIFRSSPLNVHARHDTMEPKTNGKDDAVVYSSYLLNYTVFKCVLNSIAHRPDVRSHVTQRTSSVIC